MSNIYVYQHLGLGDFISCNGLIRTLLKKIEINDNLYLFTPSQYEGMISFMYRDEPKIKTVSLMLNKKKIKGKTIRKKDINKSFQETKTVEKFLKSLPNQNYEFIAIGYDLYWPTSNLNQDKNMPWTADMIFYKQMNIPYKFRYTKCYWQRDKIAEEMVFNRLVKDKSKPYAFIHDEPERGFLIKDENILSNLQIVRNSSKVNIFDFGLILERASEIHVMESSIRCMLETLDTSKAQHYLYRFTNGPWKSVPYYIQEKNIFVGTSKKWLFKDVEFNEIKKNWFRRIFKL
jgi:hypothetical protein